MPLEQPTPPPLKVTNLRVTAQKRQLFCGWASVGNWRASGAFDWEGDCIGGWLVCLVGGNWLLVLCVSIELPALVNGSLCQALWWWSMWFRQPRWWWVVWFIMNFSWPIHFYRHFIPRSSCVIISGLRASSVADCFCAMESPPPCEF